MSRELVPGLDLVSSSWLAPELYVGMFICLVARSSLI